MYAKQAERYTGESSLNDDTSLKIIIGKLSIPPKIPIMINNDEKEIITMRK